MTTGLGATALSSALVTLICAGWAGLTGWALPLDLLMILAALGQADASRSLTVARALAYSMSVVSVAVILGPNTPLTLSVQIFKAEAPLLALDTHIDPGDVMTVMGLSGIGRLALFSFVIGTLPGFFQTSGRVLLDGADIADLRPAIQQHCPVAKKRGWR